MPYQRTWSHWPVVWLNDDMSGYLKGPNFNAQSITTRFPELREGLCFGTCIQWFHRFFDQPYEAPLDRMRHLKKRFGSAAATQFIHREIAATRRHEAEMTRFSYDNGLGAAARVSRVKFKYRFMCRQPDNSGSIAQMVATLKNERAYYLGVSGQYAKPRGVFFEALASVLGCILSPAPVPSAFGHAVTLVYYDAGPSKFFDVSLGEFEIGPNQFGRFLGDYCRTYKSNGYTIEAIHVFEVRQAEAFAPAHKHLGRNRDLDRSDIV